MSEGEFMPSNYIQLKSIAALEEISRTKLENRNLYEL